MRIPAQRPLFGIVLMGIAFLVLSFNDMFGKFVVSDNLPPLQIVFLRGSFLLFMLLIYGVIRHKRGRSFEMTSRLPMHVVRSLIAFFSVWTFFLGLKNLDIATVTILLFVAPFFIAILAWLFLGERIPRQSFIAITGGFLGALIVIAPWGKPSDGATPIFWLLVMMSSAISWAGSMVAMRSLARTDDSFTILVMFNALVAFYSAFFLPFIWQPVSFKALLLIAGMSCCQFISQMLMAEAYSYASPAVTAPVQYSQIIYTALIGFFVFGTVPSGQTWIGGAVIVASGLYLIASQRRR